MALLKYTRLLLGTSFAKPQARSLGALASRRNNLLHAKLPSSKNQKIISHPWCIIDPTGIRHKITAIPGQDYLIRQLFDNQTFTYTYLLADPESKESILIDPVLELVDRDVHLVKDLGLNLLYTVNTHVHADHVTGSGEIGKLIPSCKSVVGETRAKSDVYVKHGDVINFGKFQIECRGTPGHTDGCMSFVWHEKSMAFTGDALLIRGCGRTDFQQGSSEVLYKSVHEQILSLPDDFLLYPGHDYTGQTMTTVLEEKTLNTRLTKPIEEFKQIMTDLKLPYPKQIDRALPANMVDGLIDQIPPKT